MTKSIDLSNKNLSNLIGTPNQLDDHFNCSYNQLTTLNGSPSHLGGYFSCDGNKLTTLIGSPNYVGRHFSCEENRLTSLFGAPKVIKWHFFIRNNTKLLDISDIWDSDIRGYICFDLNPGMAALPLNKFQLWPFKNDTIHVIHKRNRGSSKQNILDFQYDLIENGFSDNAKWKP